MLELQIRAVMRLRKLHAAGMIPSMPYGRYLWGKLCVSKKRRLTDGECMAILEKTDAAIKELR